MVFLRILVLGGFSFTVLGCSSGSENSAPQVQSSTTNTISLETFTSNVLSSLLSQISVTNTGWRCDEGDERAESKDMVTRLKEFNEWFSSDCIWSDIGVVQIDLYCGRSAKLTCEDRLKKAADATSAFTVLDVSKMLQTRMIDGMQTASTGMTTWNITERGIHLIIDTNALQLSGNFHP